MPETRPERRRKQGHAAIYLSLVPLILVLLIVRAYPIGSTIVKSFTNWDGLFRSDFVGLRNYISIFTSQEFFHMLRNNLILLLHIPIQLVLAFIFALLLYEKTFGWKVFRSLFFLPSVISAVIIGTVFRAFFALDGPVNMILRSIGLEGLAVDWLGRGGTAMFVLMVAIIWQGLGWQMMIISGGLATMDLSVLEAAKIDGAGYWNRLFHIVIPLQIRAIEYSFVVSIVWVFSGMFTFIYSITNGGPGYDTTTLDYMIYLKAFVSGNQLGSASASAVILLIIVLVLIRIQTAITNRADDWSE